MAGKNTRTSKRPMTRQKLRPAPIVLTPKSQAAAKRIRTAFRKLLLADLLRPMTYEQARAFLDRAPDWEGPGMVLVMRPSSTAESLFRSRMRIVGEPETRRLAAILGSGAIARRRR